MKQWAVVFGLSMCAFAGPAPEVRGVWVARDSLASRQKIADTFDRLKAANFNAVFVNVWSRGYPLWKSEVFELETGVPTDPAFDGRDVLQEASEEAKARGLAVVAWFEYGFVAGWSGNVPAGSMGPLLDKHPDWVARKRDGSADFDWAGGTRAYWMVHSHSDVRQFLFRLLRELARNYDVAAIQFDRARYPSTDCGYDSYTRDLYAGDNEGAAPPSDDKDPAWMRWRADELNAFVRQLNRELKTENWRLLSTNAPIVYSYSYVNFLQEYPSWAKAGALDFVSPQVYRATLEAFEAELDRQRAALAGSSWLVPGVDATNPTADALVGQIQAVRARALPGVVLWYAGDLERRNLLDELKQRVFQEAAPLPWR